MVKLNKVYKYIIEEGRGGWRDPAEFVHVIKSQETNKALLVCLNLKRQRITTIHCDYFRSNISGILYVPYKDA